MSEDIHAALIRTALAELLPRVQGKVPTGGDDNEDMQRVWKPVHLSIFCPTLAALLPGVSGEEEEGII